MDFRRNCLGHFDLRWLFFNPVSVWGSAFPGSIDHSISLHSRIFGEQKITVKNKLRNSLNADAEGSSAVYEAGHREQ
jgi:hypothetical protein